MWLPFSCRRAPYMLCLFMGMYISPLNSLYYSKEKHSIILSTIVLVGMIVLCYLSIYTFKDEKANMLLFFEENMIKYNNNVYYYA
ncbi:hypothetical protein SAMN05216529_107168 [Faecalicatena contorta]|uniref:Uncharacterized protein n=1 Tax=Faecalicatena contorta TaxID=39482 RepID=A0A315ZVW0_9FIRM|nr:hypothetical protein A8805_107168 [Faecalicatena contorta]SUQ14713.1 hypothetical protein SAMN05216529_107168 [Faecalicatena contorta]